MIGEELLRPDELAIARSVLYAALFEYPLSLAQLRQTLIESQQTPSQILAAYRRSPVLQSMVEYRDGFFFPRGRGAWLGERARRQARSRAFLRRHRLLLSCICAMPYVRMVALSGSIAHLNLERDGDLDLFIVTRGRHAWTATVAVILLSKLLGSRRVVCANYTVSDGQLAFEPRDLFTASQIIHLRPLIGRDVYRHLLAQNPFVYRFYPNFHDAVGAALPMPRFRAWPRTKKAVELVLRVPADLVEYVCRTAYRWYLVRQAAGWTSPGQVRLQPECLKLHTHSHRRNILERFDRSLGDALRTFELVR